MHDTHLIEKISEKVIGLCEEKKISVINELCVGVHKDSYVTAENLAAFLNSINQTLIGSETRIHVLRNLPEENTAVIQSIEGQADGKCC